MLAFVPFGVRFGFERLVLRLVHDVNRFWIVRFLRWLLTLLILGAIIWFARTPVQAIAALFQHNAAVGGGLP